MPTESQTGILFGGEKWILFKDRILNFPSCYLNAIALLQVVSTAHLAELSWTSIFPKLLCMCVMGF